LGDRVKAGDVLLVVDSPDIAQAYSEYVKEDSDLQYATRSHELAKDLYSNKALPLKDLKQAENELVKARAEFRRAKERLLSLRVPAEELNKPLDKQRKSVLDFCYVIHNNGSIPLKEWLRENSYQQEHCGLTAVDHFRDVYLLYHQQQLSGDAYFRGIISGPDADHVQLSPVPKGLDHIAVLNFNKDGYSVYCKEYREYLQWEEKRNELRYQSTLSHGKSYDAKNMMHTFRLLNMAEEIALYREVRVHREDRDFLLRIRSGEFEFDELMQMVEDKMERIREVYQKADLPEQPDLNKAENLLIEIRNRFY